METKIKALEGRLNFMSGQLDAVLGLVAAFIGLSPGASAFVKKVPPQLAKSTESAYQNNQVSQLYVDGFSHALKVCSDLIEETPRFHAGDASQRT